MKICGVSYYKTDISQTSDVHSKAIKHNGRDRCKTSRSFLVSLVMLGFCATVCAEDIEKTQKQTATSKTLANTTKSRHVHKQAAILFDKSSDCKDSYQIIDCTDKKIHLPGITITPGGFLAGEGVWRSRNEQTDVGSTFSGIPLGNNPLAHMHEFRLSARQSRASALVEGKVNQCTLLSGYYEIDFLGNGTGNETESNSFDARIRVLYAAVDRTDWGLHVLAGQNWSLVTTNSKGITQRNEVIPPTIDAQYVVGFVWKRQPQFRLTKNFGSEFWAAISIENPQTTFGGTICGTALPGITNEICSAPGTQSLPSTTIFSLNHIPDVIGKLAYESKINCHKFHIEGFALYRDFYDRVQRTANIHNTNKNTTGFGIGAGVLIEILRELLDFQGNFMAGRGIGSYASGLLPDVTLGLNGKLTPIPEVMFMLGATFHALPTLDIYVFGGEEKESRKYFQVGPDFFGYGVPNANNLGCNIENGICVGNTDKLWQVSVGLWDNLYKGAFGELRAGLQYSYTKRDLFSGTGGGSPVPVGNSTDDHMVFASLRYYPFT